MFPIKSGIENSSISFKAEPFVKSLIITLNGFQFITPELYNKILENKNFLCKNKICQLEIRQPAIG